MEIKLDLKIVLFAVIFYFTGQIEIYSLCVLFALIHEMGHILAGRLLGYKLKTLKIMPVGFSIFFKININDYNKKIIKRKQICIKKFINSNSRTTYKYNYFYKCIFPKNR